MEHIIFTFFLLSCGFFHTILSYDNSIAQNLRTLPKNRNETIHVNYGPDTELNTLQMIRKAGYPAEAHIVTTADGYILEIHRIPRRSSSQSVFLQHGLLGSSADWVIPGKEKSLAYILADHGYDVWLGNFRGNTYSRGHVSLSITDPKYWNFSWHEIGIYDLPAIISYITDLRKVWIDAYIGHSMGTTTFYVMAAEKPLIASRVRSMYSLAPVAYMKHLKSPIRFLAPFANDYKTIVNFFGNGEFLPQNSLLKFLAKYGCDIDVLEEKICTNSLFVICGFDNQQFNYTLMPVILSHTPAGASTKTLVHYSQTIESGAFRQYDHGPEKNMKVYNSTEPPDYNLSNISVPIALFYADNDWLASPVDVLKLSSMLKKKLTVYRIPFSKFNHVDFIWGIDAPKLVYTRLLYVMEKYKRSQKKATSIDLST